MLVRGIDLHLHSAASDGALTPTELVHRAREQGLQAIALTDHDTVDGLAEARRAAENCGIQLINGIELSCVWNGMTLHIVGLQIDPEAEAIRELTRLQQDNRLERAKVIADRLGKQNFGNVWDGVRQMLGPDRVPARPDFARYLVDKGYVDRIQQAFDSYLGAGKLGDVKQFWPSLEAVVKAIVESGGVAVIAHPMRYKQTTAKLRRLILEFKSYGGQAIEVAVANLDSGRIGLLTELCRQYDLYASCGSDFHMPGRPWQEIGRFPPLPAGLKPVWNLWAPQVCQG